MSSVSQLELILTLLGVLVAIGGSVVAGVWTVSRAISAVRDGVASVEATAERTSSVLAERIDGLRAAIERLHDDGHSYRERASLLEQRLHEVEAEVARMPDNFPPEAWVERLYSRLDKIEARIEAARQE